MEKDLKNEDQLKLWQFTKDLWLKKFEWPYDWA